MPFSSDLGLNLFNPGVVYADYIKRGRESLELSLMDLDEPLEFNIIEEAASVAKLISAKAEMYSEMLELVSNATQFNTAETREGLDNLIERLESFNPQMSAKKKSFNIISDEDDETVNTNIDILDDEF